MKIIMLGLIGTGGVSTHTKALNQELLNFGHEVLFYNYYTKKDHNPGVKDIKTFINNLFQFKNLILGFLIFLINNRKKADILHIQCSGPMGGFLPGIIGVFYGRIFNIPNIVTFHHSKTEHFIKKNRLIFKYVVKKTNLLIVVSEKQKNIISKYYNKEYDSKVLVIPNGFFFNNKKVPNKLENFEKMKIKKDDVVLINIAWLLEKKGHIYLVKALEEVIKYNKSVKCFCVGKGPLYNSLINEVNERKLAENLFFLVM